MARNQRIPVALTDKQLEALRKAQKSLGLGSLASTANHLLTGALERYVGQDHGVCRGSGQDENVTFGLPNGYHPVTVRLPLSNNNNYIQEGGECERGGNPGGYHPVTERLPSTEVRECLGILKSIDGWPFDVEKDYKYLMTLIVEFPKVDPLETCKRLQAHSLDNKIKPNGARSRLRTFFKKAEGFGQVRKQQPAQPATGTEIDTDGILGVMDD